MSAEQFGALGNMRRVANGPDLLPIAFYSSRAFICHLKRLNWPPNGPSSPIQSQGGLLSSYPTFPPPPFFPSLLPLLSPFSRLPLPSSSALPCTHCSAMEVTIGPSICESPHSTFGRCTQPDVGERRLECMFSPPAPARPHSCTTVRHNTQVPQSGVTGMCPNKQISACTSLGCQQHKAWCRGQQGGDQTFLVP